MSNNIPGEDEEKMRRTSRLLVLWTGIILIWTCCLLITCLVLNDTMCLEEEICDHVTDDAASRARARLMGRYREFYENVPDLDDVSEYLARRSSPKRILLHSSGVARSWGVAEGDAIFRQMACPSASCSVGYDDAAERRRADVVVLRAADIRSRDDLPSSRPPGQIWLLYAVEPPDLLEGDLSVLNGLVNWTATYTAESDFPLPFGVYRELRQLRGKNAPSERTPSRRRRGRQTIPTDRRADDRPWDDSVLRGKGRVVVAFTEGRRPPPEHERYVHELGMHVPVDVYDLNGTAASCGTRRQCLDMIRTRYKFYLAFEESGCRQYITDRFWRVALGHDVVPVVMGPPRADYEQVAPPHSFIHVSDFDTPASLAAYLGELDANGTRYGEYFRWRRTARVRYAAAPDRDPNLWCALCARLHEPGASRRRQVYHRLDEWWSAKRQCHRHAAEHSHF